MALIITGDRDLDLVTGTLQKYGRLSFNLIGQPLNDYPVLRMWLRKESIKVRGGRGLNFNEFMEVSGANATPRGLFAPDNVSVAPHMAQLSAGWSHISVNWTYDTIEKSMNTGQELLFDVIKPREVDAMLRLAGGCEDQAWGLRTSAQGEYVNGVPYYVVKSDTEGYNGGRPSGHTDVAGIDPNDWGNAYKNYSAQHTNVTKDDLFRKMRTFHRKSKWTAPIKVSDYDRGQAQNFTLYTCGDVMDELGTLGEQQNENLGADLDKYDGRMMWKGHPFVWVPKLDDDTEDPIYCIDHSCFHTFVLSGQFLERRGPIQKANHHTTYCYFIDLSWQVICTDRRRQAVFHK